MASAVSAILGDLPAILPFIGSIVTGVEHLFHHKANSGESKKQAAMDMVKAGLGVLQQVETVPGTPLSNSTLAQDISSAIDAVVAIYNDIGVFTHGKPAPTSTK